MDDDRDTREEDEREHLRWCRDFIERSPDGIGRIDLDGRYIYANPACGDRLGVALDELIGKGPDILAERLDPASAAALADSAQIAMTERRPDTVEIRIKGPDGETIWALHTATPWYTASGEFGGLEFHAKIITELKQAALDKERLLDQLARIQTLEAVGTLAGGIAHDFNNLLQVVQGVAEVALGVPEPGGPGQPYRDYFARILRVARRARDLTLKLLAFARGENLSLTTVSINDLVRGVVEFIENSLLKERQELRLELRLVDQSCDVTVDPLQVERALLNIITNACDAIPESGTVRVETSVEEVVEPTEGWPQPLVPGSYVALRIIDDGVGIPEDARRRIFEPFFTTKEAGRGTGLGLSTAHGIVARLGGAIDVRSHEGQGSEFTVFFPAAGSPAAAAVQERATQIERGVETLLVIDDEEFNLEIAELILESRGYTVLSALGGADGLETFRERHSEIDLVLLDMIMPDPDGPRVFHAVRAIDPQARVIAVSGYSQQGRYEALEAAGAAGFVQKPYTAAELCAAIRSVLDG